MATPESLESSDSAQEVNDSYVVVTSRLIMQYFSTLSVSH